MQNSHIFHQAKLLSFIKISQLAQRYTGVKHIIPGKTRAAESYRWIMQGLLSPRQKPNPVPQLNNNLCQLPRAVSLERRSLGLTHSKMLTNFHTLRHENKDRLVLVHYPSKSSKLIYNKLTEKCQPSQNIEHKILLPRSFIAYTNKSTLS